MVKVNLLFLLFIVTGICYGQEITGTWRAIYPLNGDTVINDLTIIQEGNTFSGLEFLKRGNKEYPLQVSGEKINDSTYTFNIMGALNHLVLRKEDDSGEYLRTYDEHMELVPENKNYATHYYRLED